MRARMAIKLAEVRCELREVVLKRKPEALLHCSPKGTVPVLVSGDAVIDESLDIMRYAFNQLEHDDWGVGELAHSLVQQNDTGFKQSLDQYKYHDRFPEHSQQHYFAQAEPFLAQLEATMVEGRAAEFYILTPKLSAIDLAIFPFIRQFAFVNMSAFNALPWIKLKAWFERLLASHEFTSVMEKYPEWDASNRDPIYF